MIIKARKQLITILMLVTMILFLFQSGTYANEDSGTTEVTINTSNDNYLLEPFKLELIKTEIYPISLEDTLDLAISNNINLQSTKAQWKIDKLDKYVKLSEFLPSITPSYEQYRFQGAVQIFGNQIYKIYRTSIEPRATLSYTIFSGGQTIFQYLEAKRKQKATEYSLCWVKDKLLNDTTIAYYDLLKSYKALEIADKELQESRTVLELNQSRLDNGLGTILEVTQSETQLANSKSKVIQANKKIAFASQNLNYILNLPINLKIIPDDYEITKETIFTDQNFEVEKFLDIAFENRSDLKQQKEIKKVYLAQKKIALSKFFPKVNINAYLGGSGPRVADLQEARMIGYSVQLDFLKNMGVNYLANYKKSTPMIKQADLNIESKIREIEKNIADSLLEYESTLKEIDIAKKGLVSAKKSFEYATERLNAGVGTNIDVISAQVQQTLARFGLLKAVINHNKSQINLLYYLGIISKDKILGQKDALSFDNSPKCGDDENIKK